MFARSTACVLSIGLGASFRAAELIITKRTGSFQAARDPASDNTNHRSCQLGVEQRPTMTSAGKGRIELRLAACDRLTGLAQVWSKGRTGNAGSGSFARRRETGKE